MRREYLRRRDSNMLARQTEKEQIRQEVARILKISKRQQPNSTNSEHLALWNLWRIKNLGIVSRWRRRNSWHGHSRLWKKTFKIFYPTTYKPTKRDSTTHLLIKCVLYQNTKRLLSGINFYDERITTKKSISTYNFQLRDRKRKY